jgi:uncharacterized protein (TIGR04255 family)
VECEADVSGAQVANAKVDPFAGDVPEIFLPSAPLARVVAQLRYPRPLDFEGDGSVEPLRRVLAPRYPVGRRVQATAVVLTPSGVTQQPSAEVNWTFEDIAGEWKLTISNQFISIESTRYISRNDFCDRFSEAVRAFANVMHPPVYDRLGVRYVNMLKGEGILADLNRLVNPVALAGLVVPHANVQVQHSLCDSIFVDKDIQLQARWGWLPAGVSVDPTVAPPDLPYWLLDIDSYTGRGGAFDVDLLDGLTRDLALRAHRLFRWVVTDDFLTHFGGRP